MAQTSPSTPTKPTTAREIPDSTESSPVTPDPLTKFPPAKSPSPRTTSKSTTPPPPSVHAHASPLLSTTISQQSSSTNPPPLQPSPHLTRLHTQITHLHSLISTTSTTLSTTLGKLHSLHDLSPSAAAADPGTVVKSHIRLLHEYNEIKDVGQGLMGMIADARGVRLREVMEEMGVGEKD